MALSKGNSIKDMQLAEMRRALAEEKRRRDVLLRQQRSVAPRPGRGTEFRGAPSLKGEGFSSRGGWGEGGPPGDYRPRSDNINVHEILKTDMFGSRSGPDDNHFEKSRPSPSSVYGISDQYVVLDSFEKVQSSKTQQGEFQFNFMVQGVTRDQTIGVKERLDTIIGIQTCDFCIPNLPLDDFSPTSLTTLNPSLSVLALAANPALKAPDNTATTGNHVPTSARSQTPFCSRVTMFLKEIGLQSFSDVNNRRHHFEYEAEPVSTIVNTSAGSTDKTVTDRLHLKPLEHCQYYLFTDPIQDVHGLTVAFYNPGNPLRFPPDCLYAVTAAASNPGQFLVFTYVDPTNLVNLAVGDRVFIRGFAANNATASTDQVATLNNYVNRSEGHLVGGGGFALTAPTSSTSGTTVVFRLNPDVSVAAFGYAAGGSVTSSKQIDVCIAKNRVRIPLRLRRVVPRLTNYISP